MSENMAKCPKCGSDKVTVDFRYPALNASQCYACDHVDLPDAFLLPIARLQAERDELLKALKVMDGALKISADLAAAIKPLIPNPDILRPERRELWQQVINAIFTASAYADQHDLKQWGGKVEKVQ